MELTQEQKDAIIKAFKQFCEEVKKLWERIKAAIRMIAKGFHSYAASLNPKKRYKLLKSIGIKNYVPLFRRDGVIHCRNNC